MDNTQGVVVIEYVFSHTCLEGKGRQIIMLPRIAYRDTTWPNRTEDVDCVQIRHITQPRVFWSDSVSEAYANTTLHCGYALPP
jgi:hypothetical protein